MFRLVEIQALPGYRLHVRFADGVEGEVDVSHLVGHGVFAVWNDPRVFQDVTIESSGEPRWGDTIDLCPDALYLTITGKSPEDVFPNLAKSAVDA